MPTSLTLWALSLLVLAGCFFSLWKGGPAERPGAAIILANLLLTILATTFLSPETVAISGLVVDGLSAVGLMIIALRYASPWLGGAMLLYGIQFSLRAYYFVAERPDDNFHAIVNNVDFMGIIFCMVVATTAAWRGRSAANRAAAN